MQSTNPFEPLSRLELPSPLLFIPGAQYGEADELPLYLDLLFSSSISPMPRPAVVYIHGGGWGWGNRGEAMQPLLSPFLAAHGFFTASITYRLSWQAPFPAQIYDAKAAIRWLRANAERYNIDAEHIGVWGSSAGAHLASLLGTTEHVSSLEGESGSSGYSSCVQAVLVHEGPSDFFIPGGYMGTSPPEITRLFRGPVEDHQELARLASPLTHVHSGVPPFFVVHGTHDEIVPFEHAQRLVEALKAVGGEVVFHPIEGGDHGWGSNWGEIAQQYLAFFQKHLCS